MILWFLIEVFAGKPDEGAGFGAPELLVLAAIYVGVLVLALVRLVVDARALELAWRSLP